ncbi:hypothetical protein [Methylobacterium sp. P5_C11]
MRDQSGWVAILLLLGAAPASGQTVLAPSGDSAVTQPGGTQGRSARRNIQEAFRNGDVIGHPSRPVNLGMQRDRSRHRAPRF